MAAQDVDQGPPGVASRPADRGLRERGRESERIAASLERTRESRGEVLLIEGPAGIGKTRLVQETCALAAERGFKVLSARATELEREFPFGAARQLLVPPLRASDRGERAALLAGAASLAASVLEEPPPPGFSIPTSDAQFAALHGLYWMLANLADSGPVLLAIDDLQWADESTLRLIEFVAPRLRELPVQLTMTLRSGEPSPYDELIERIAAEASTASLRPEPLSSAAVSSLLGEALEAEPDAEFASAVHRAVAGNPLFLGLLAEELRRERISPTANEAHRVGEVGPATVSRTVLVRCSGLAPGAPSVAQAVAVLGDGARIVDVAELAELERRAAIAAANDLARVGILRDDELAFVHPVVRNAIYEDIGATMRGALHRIAARLLASAAVAPERVASQLLRAERTGDTDAVEALREAARSAAARGSPRVAATYLARALEEPPPAAERGAILLELGSAEARAGSEAARHHLAAAGESVGEDWVRVLAAVELAQVLCYAGEVGRAADLVRAALARVDARSEGLVRVAEMALLVMAETDVEARAEAGELLGRAEAAVERLGARAPRGLLTIVAVERAFTGATAAEAGQLAELALEDGRLFDEQGVDMPHPGFATGTLVMTGRFDLAEHHLGVAIEKARGRGSARGYAFASAVRAWARYRSGALAGAEADAQACLDLGPGPSWALFRPLALSALVDVLVERGDLTGAEAALARWPELESALPNSMLTQPLREARARLAIGHGKPDAAREPLEACEQWERAWGARGASWTSWRSTAAIAHASRGEGEAAAALATEEVDLARAFGAPRQLGVALRALGLVRGGEEGVTLLEAAAAELEDSGAELELARALVDHGAALRRAGERRRSREPLRRGLDLAGRCAANALAQRARLELEAAGGRVPQRPLSGVASLSPRQRRVAELAAEGMSNPEIAQALFVTRKTVEAHLRAIFRKLDVTAREQLAPMLAEEGAAGDA